MQQSVPTPDASSQGGGGDVVGRSLCSLEICISFASNHGETKLRFAEDPNSIGRYHRSPLWRAAYAGNDELIRVLLRSGGDPRECDEQGPDEVDDAVME